MVAYADAATWIVPMNAIRANPIRPSPTTISESIIARIPARGFWRWRLPRVRARCWSAFSSSRQASARDPSRAARREAPVERPLRPLLPGPYAMPPVLCHTRLSHQARLRYVVIPNRPFRQRFGMTSVTRDSHDPYRAAWRAGRIRELRPLIARRIFWSIARDPLECELGPAL